MRVIILGAGGKSGQRLVAGALARGYEVTAFVRDADRFGRSAAGSSQVRVVTGDVRDDAALAAAITGHDAVVNAAGTLFDDDFVAVVGGVIATVARTLGAGGRLWLYGGAAILPMAGTRWLGVDLPFVPKIYRRHRVNFDSVRATGTRLVDGMSGADECRYRRPHAIRPADHRRRLAGAAPARPAPRADAGRRARPAVAGRDL